MTGATGDGHIFLVGFMGAGKSTVGHLVSEMLGRPFMDLDAEIERSAGLTCAQLFAERGEDAFRALETSALVALAHVDASVVACGGGIVLRDENRRLLKQLGTTVYLEVTAGEALARIGDVEGRPLLAEGGPQVAATLLRARAALYRASADVIVNTVGRGPEDVAASVLEGIGVGGEEG
jgi:shikimate kinase